MKTGDIVFYEHGYLQFIFEVDYVALVEVCGIQELHVFPVKGSIAAPSKSSGLLRVLESEESFPCFECRLAYGELLSLYESASLV